MAEFHPWHHVSIPSFQSEVRILRTREGCQRLLTTSENSVQGAAVAVVPQLGDKSPQEHGGGEESCHLEERIPAIPQEKGRTRGTRGRREINGGTQA